MYRVVNNRLCIFASGRQRKWFTVEDALKHLRLHKPVQMTYLETLLTCNRRLNKVS